MRSIMSVLALATLCSVAVAGFTSVGSSGEASFVDILNNVYGSGFGGTPFGGLAYTNGTITLTRIDDNGFGSPMSLLNGTPGSANDQEWQDGTVVADARARFAGFSQSFGWAPAANYGNPNHGYQNLFNVTGAGFQPWSDGRRAVRPEQSVFVRTRRRQRAALLSRQLERRRRRPHADIRGDRSAAAEDLAAVF